MKNQFRKKLESKSGFVVLAELAAGPGFNLLPVQKFLEDYKSAGQSAIPDEFDFAAVTATQSPGGVANVEPAYVLDLLESKNLLDSLDFIPHLSCKDYNRSALFSSLVGFKEASVESILALTGDKPVGAKGVFELDSIGLLALIRKLNNSDYEKAKLGSLDSVHQFFAGAAVSPFKYTQASQMQQYFKMEKKIATGAGFLITQVGWDWRKSLELFQYMQKNDIDTPVIGNVYLLSTTNPAPRLMHDIKLPGCFVSDEFLAKLYSETFDEHVERAAQQVAMYKSIGAAGVDLGGVHDFDVFIKILKRAAEIGQDWQQYKDNLCWPAKNTFYLYDESGKPKQASQYRKKLNQRCFDIFHRFLLDADYKGFHVFKKIMSLLGTKKGKGFFYKSFFSFEKVAKYLLFDCKECGDCFLPENFGLCTIGGCEKGMDNAPCGDATVDGRCGNNLDRVCIGERIYEAAGAKQDGLKKLRTIINKSRNPALEHSASILNYLFGKDHTMKNAIITIGESVHASIPKTGEIMKQLVAIGDDAYTKQSEQLGYIQALIESQAADGADYIAVNLDAFGEADPQIAVDMMVEYVKMVRRWSSGVPICIDSSDDNVLIAGLKEWYNTTEPIKPPLINSVKIHTMDNMLPLKKHYDYSFVGLLVTDEPGEALGGLHSIDQLYNLAKRIFDTATENYGFKPSEIFFDSTVFPLSIDMPMMPGAMGYTYRAFETIKKIKSDPKMKDVHFSLGVSNSVRDLPARKVGLCRAYVAKAMEYGLDAGIVNAAHKYGSVEPDTELFVMVDAFAKMDGSAEKTNNAMTLMGEFCQKNRKPAK